MQSQRSAGVQFQSLEDKNGAYRNWLAHFLRCLSVCGMVLIKFVLVANLFQLFQLQLGQKIVSEDHEYEHGGLLENLKNATLQKNVMALAWDIPKNATA